MTKHLLELEGMTQDELISYFQVADTYSQSDEHQFYDHLAGRIVANLFFENSTRTANSFYLAAKRLGATTLDFTGAGSSISKGETLLDTARNIRAMGVDLFVVRHVSPGSAHIIAQNLNVPVINAGDGFHEHPTQGLLDSYTLYRELGGVDSLKNLTVAIVGDILHSRVARSNIHALRAFGARIICVGPPTLLPENFKALGCEISYSLDEVLESVDVLMFLRLQKERMVGGLVSSLKEYRHLYGMTRKRLARCRPNLKIMHPGPINRGIEIDPEIADGPNSLILQQVTYGIVIRMAILKILIGESNG